MRLFLKQVTILLLIVFAVSSCNKSVPKQVNYIPKDATAVFSINAKQLQDKLAKGNLTIDSLIKIFSDAADTSGKKFQELKDAGIDWSSDLFLFMENKGSAMTGRNVSGGAVVLVKDAAKLEAFIKKQPGSGEIKKGSNYSYAKISDNAFAGWNKDILVVVVGAYGGDMDGMPRRYSDNIDSSDVKTDNNAGEQQLSALFSLKEADAISSISEFNELAKQKSDAAFWGNTSSSLSAVPMLGMTKASDLFKNMYTATTINFEDGKAVADSKTYLSKEFSDILKKHDNRSSDYSMIEHYPSNNITGLALWSFDPQILGDIIKFSGFDGTANQYLSKEGLTMDDILKAFKGDFAFVYSDFEVQQQASAWDSTYKSTKPTGKYVFNAKVGDKASFDKVMAFVSKWGIFVKQNNVYVLATANPNYTAEIDDKNIIVANNNTTLKEYKEGKAKMGLEGEVKDKVKGKSFSMYVDISKLLTNSVTTIDTSRTAVANLAKATFKDALFTTDNLSGNNLTGHGELRTVNTKENSLVSIVKFMSFAAAKEKERKNTIVVKDVYLEDTGFVPPPLPPPPVKHK
ncbi:DUF4836 family protein [Chitinophagaceae bacterium LWZ2-11]